MIIAINIGYIGPLGSGILTYHPTIWEVENIQSLIQEIRSKETVNMIFKWAKHRYVTPSSMALFIAVGNHNFTIKMSNVREYKKKWDKKYKKAALIPSTKNSSRLVAYGNTNQTKINQFHQTQ